MQRTFFLITIAVIILIGGAFFLLQPSQKQRDLPTARVSSSDVIKTISVDGTLTPEISADIASEIPVRIASVAIKKNDHVSKGDVLFTLDKQAVMAQIRNARLAVERAELAEKQARRKWETLKPEERQDIKKATAQSREILNELYAQAEKTTVRAPISGTVTTNNATVGEVAQGTIVTIIDTNSLRMEALIPEVDIAKVVPGMHATVVLDAYPNTPLSSQVTNIDAGSIVKQNITYYKAILAITTPDDIAFLEGMNADIFIETSKKSHVLSLPRTFVQKDDDGYYVFIPTHNTKRQTEKKYFQEGLIGDKSIEILSGLAHDDVVVRVPKQ